VATVNPLSAFKSDPEKKLARDLDAARANRGKLTERLKATELALSERRAGAQRLARDGANDSELDAAEAALRSAQDRRSTLAAALVDVERHVQDLERAQDDLAAKKLRVETAATIEKLALEVGEAAAAFDAGAEKLGECTARAAAIITDAKGLEIFATSARTEVSGAVAMISGLLRSRATEVLKGNAPAKLPKPDVPIAFKPAPVATPTKRIFALAHLKWIDESGEVKTLARYMAASDPLRLARLAIEKGLADEATTHRARQLAEAHGCGFKDATGSSPQAARIMSIYRSYSRRVTSARPV
jgi:HAMP domain-containing protein